MSLKIKVKRISGVPSTSDLESGEIGLNTSNNQLYVNIGGTITAVSGGSSDAEENESSFKSSFNFITLFSISRVVQHFLSSSLAMLCLILIKSCQT